MKSHTSFSTANWNGLNILNSSLNNAGTNSLYRFPRIQTKDLMSYTTLYFFSASLYIFSLKKLLELRVLNYLKTKKNKKIPKIAIYQSSGVENISWFTKNLKKNDSLRSSICIPTENVYTSINTYVNTEGLLKKSVSIVVSKLNLKNDWKFLRRIFKYTKKKFFLHKI